MDSTTASSSSYRPAVPEGWEAYFDDDSQRWYYYNCQSKKAQWKDPNTSTRNTFRRFLSSAFSSGTEGARAHRRRKSSPSRILSQQPMEDTRDDEEVARALQEEEYNLCVLTWPHSSHDEESDSMDIDGLPPTISESSRLRGSGLESEHEANSSQECSICMDDDDPEAEWTWLECAHHYHTACVEAWLKTANQCPICRTKCTLDGSD